MSSSCRGQHQESHCVPLTIAQTFLELGAVAMLNERQNKGTVGRWKCVLALLFKIQFVSRKKNH